jgi:hypothetical protein
MTKVSALTSRRAVAALTALVGLVAALLLAPGARSGGASIGVCNGATPTSCTGGPFSTGDGVYFTVTTGGGNRDFASVAVSCDNGESTVLNVIVPAKGSGNSDVIHPSAGTCTAVVEKQMQIGKARELGTVSFSVS